ncbi:MAG TPA: hypothetical protein VF611_12410 [Pyrinomonadaceae bacterium]
MKKRLIDIVSVCLLMTALPSSLPAQRAGRGAADGVVMTNADVIRLVKLGVAEHEIIGRIRRSKPRFDTSAGALKRLRKAGVGDELIREVLNPRKVAHVSGSDRNGAAPCVQPPGGANAPAYRSEYDGQPPSRFYEFIKPDDASTRRLQPAPAPDDRRQPFQNRLKRIGVVNPLTPPLTTSEHGKCFDLGRGYDEVLRVVSEGARQVRLRFASVALPPGAKLFVSSGKNPGEVYGPYEGRGPSADDTFWTPPVDGDTVVVEYYIPLPASERGGRRVPFKITEVSHIY